MLVTDLQRADWLGCAGNPVLRTPHGPHGELFDLTRDPVQRCNRWADPAAAPLRREMAGRLLAKIVDTQARHQRQIAVA